MNDHRTKSWKTMILGVLAGLSISVLPAIGQVTDSPGAPTVRTDNQGAGSLNSGPGSLGSGRRGGDDLRVAQVGDVRQEDRRGDRQQDRQEVRQDDRRSNAGGAVRGLDRADQVAGEHGQQGRDNARAAQLDRPNRSERVDRSQRPERMERSQRPERPERAGRN